MPTPFGEVIARRRLNPVGAPGRSVVVSLGKPREARGADHWECPFRISGSGIRRREYGRGVDAFQALTMALEGIRYFLDRLDTPLVWGDVFDDHSGFQRIIPLLPEPGGIARGMRRMERVVDREVRRWALEAKRRRFRSKRRSGTGVNP
jgi:hypothetical protein